MQGEGRRIPVGLRPDRGAASVIGDLLRGRALLSSLGLPRPRVRTRTLDTASFDVFDTLIGRAVSREALFDTVATAIIETIGMRVGVRELARSRRTAEQEAQQEYHQCATLSEIHDRLATSLDLPPDTAILTARAEIQVEFDVSRRLEEGPALLDAARLAGLRVVFVSDMHLPSTAVRSMLLNAACWEPGDQLWVSSEARARKRDGSLFRRLIDVERIVPGRTVHVGDHLISDRVVPRWLGFGVRPVGRQ